MSISSLTDLCACELVITGVKAPLELGIFTS